MLIKEKREWKMRNPPANRNINVRFKGFNENICIISNVPIKTTMARLK
ncbi:MAG: hypothetical protein K0R73_1364 [Candidatus Midichloriaceae bacterium]|jgi:hypothetical protein|nr:hypothetical protein [Candidatus Midichloriaceae bacterium]